MLSTNKSREDRGGDIQSITSGGGSLILFQQSMSVFFNLFTYNCCFFLSVKCILKFAHTNNMRL